MNLLTYDIHQNASIKAAEVGIVQYQTNLPCTVRGDVALDVFGTVLVLCATGKASVPKRLTRNLVTYDLHRNICIKAAEVGIVQQQTNLPCSIRGDVALEIDGTTVQTVIPARKHWQGYRLANIPTSALPSARDTDIGTLNALLPHLLRYTGLASGTQNQNAQHPMSAQQRVFAIAL